MHYRYSYRSSRPILSTVLLYGAAILILFAGTLIIKQVITTNRANANAEKAIALANAGKPSVAPSTIKPSTAAVNNYVVPPTHPRYLIIPKINVNARVVAVGLTKTNAIGTPSNVYDTAWYNGSNLPGQAGATLIDGHVSSWTTNGVFYNLKTLTPGDTMQVELGNGSMLTYKVVKTQVFQSNNIDVASLLRPITTGKPGLNLITCTGDVISGTSDFAERFVAYATLE
jgi:LPXTG-site transpeptidase (sortase) family protein